MFYWNRFRAIIHVYFGDDFRGRSFILELMDSLKEEKTASNESLNRKFKLLLQVSPRALSINNGGLLLIPILVIAASPFEVFLFFILHKILIQFNEITVFGFQTLNNESIVGSVYLI